MGFISNYLTHPVTLSLILESAGSAYNAYMLIKCKTLELAFENMNKENNSFIVRVSSVSLVISSVLAVATSSMFVETVSYVVQKIFSSPQHSYSMEWGGFQFYGGFIGAILGLSIHSYLIVSKHEVKNESRQLIFSTTLLNPLGVHVISYVAQKALKK